MNAREMIPARWTGAIVPGAAVAREVIQERLNQVEKWGEQNHPDGTGPDGMWMAIFRHDFAHCATIAKLQVDHDANRGTSTYAGILLEEVFEALAEDNPARLREELIQVAAVAVAWVEAIDRRLP